VSEDECAPGADIVNVGVTVLVDEVAAPTRFDKQRIPANTSKGPNRAVYSSGNFSQAPSVEGLGSPYSQEELLSESVPKVTRSVLKCSSVLIREHLNT
jgi:hypothetical protein